METLNYYPKRTKLRL